MENLKSSILKSLYFSTTQSIAEISENNGKSIPLVTKTVNELIAESYILETGRRASTGGRRAMNYMLDCDKLGCLVVLAIDQYFVHATSYNLHNEQLSPILKTSISLNDEHETYTIIEKLTLDTIDKLQGKHVLAIGITTPGFVDASSGVNNSYKKDSPLYALKERIETRFGIQTYLENDSSAIAIAEKEFGIAQGSAEAMIINLNWGVGLGMIIQNKLFRGFSGFAGEFSHIPLANEDKLCSCGKKGCLEVEASLLCAVDYICLAIQQGERSILETENLEIQELAFEKIVAAYKQGDQVSIKAISKIAHMLGKGIATLIHIMNPEIIIISGRGAVFGDTLIPAIQSAIQEYCIPRLSKNTSIKISNIDEVQLLSSACIAVQQLKWSEKNRSRQTIN